MSYGVLQQLILICHLVLCFALIGMVLIQQGKGANMGPAFGSGASNTLFGSRGPASFLMKLTGGLAILFFVTSLALGFFASSARKSESDMTLNVPAAQASAKKVEQHNTISIPKSAPTSDSQVPDLPASSPSK